MDSLQTVLEPILRRYLQEASREAVRERMERALPRIVRRMERAQVTPAAGATLVIRDSLFRLWRSVIPSGLLADLVRDLQDDRVLAVVAPHVTAETPLADAVAWTMEAVLDLAF